MRIKINNEIFKLGNANCIEQLDETNALTCPKHIYNFVRFVDNKITCDFCNKEVYRIQKII